MRSHDRRAAIGLASLTSVSLFWGTSFPLIKIVVSIIGSGAYVALRFALASILLTPYFLYRVYSGKVEARGIFASGGLLGLLYFAGIWLQGLGMEYTSASNAGFMTSLYIPIVYAIETLLRKTKGSYSLALAVILSVAGAYLIAGGSYVLRAGDLIVLAGAFFWALHVLATASFAGLYRILDLVFVQYAVTALLSLPMLQSCSAEPTGILFPILLYLAVVCSLLTGALQILGQRYATATQASLIYAMEPMFAAFFSFVVLGEHLGLIESIGALLILTSVTISSWEMARGYKRFTEGSR